MIVLIGRSEALWLGDRGRRPLRELAVRAPQRGRLVNLFTLSPVHKKMALFDP